MEKISELGDRALLVFRLVYVLQFWEVFLFTIPSLYHNSDWFSLRVASLYIAIQTLSFVFASFYLAILNFLAITSFYNLQF